MNEEKHYEGWKKEVCKAIEVGSGLALKQWNLWNKTRMEVSEGIMKTKTTLKSGGEGGWAGRKRVEKGWNRAAVYGAYKLTRTSLGFVILTLIVLMWRIGWAHNNARKQRIARWVVFVTVHPWYNNINSQLDATITVY